MTSKSKAMTPVSQQRPAAIDPAQLYRAEEAAAALSMGRASFYAAMREGSIPFIKRGRRTVISGAAIVEAAQKMLAGTFDARTS